MVRMLRRLAVATLAVPVMAACGGAPAAQETTAFRARNDQITYPESGSFVRFLIDADGIDAMRRLFGSMPGDAPLATVRAAFQNVYGYSLDEAEARWLQFLDTQ